MFVPPQLSETQHVILPANEANRTQVMTDTSAKPETVTTLQLDTRGPTRLDPGLDSAALSAGTSLTDTHVTIQQLAPAQASAFVAGLGVPLAGSPQWLHFTGATCGVTRSRTTSSDAPRQERPRGAEADRSDVKGDGGSRILTSSGHHPASRLGRHRCTACTARPFCTRALLTSVF